MIYLRDRRQLTGIVFFNEVAVVVPNRLDLGKLKCLTERESQKNAWQGLFCTLSRSSWRYLGSLFPQGTTEGTLPHSDRQCLLSFTRCDQLQRESITQLMTLWVIFSCCSSWPGCDGQQDQMAFYNLRETPEQLPSVASSHLHTMFMRTITVKEPVIVPNWFAATFSFNAGLV